MDPRLLFWSRCGGGGGRREIELGGEGGAGELCSYEKLLNGFELPPEEQLRFSAKLKDQNRNS